MCGIAGFYIKEPDFVKTDDDKGKMESFLDNLLLGIEPRGRDATGFVAQVHNGKGMLLDKRAVTASEFIKDRKKLPDKTRVVLGHARYVTKGPAENWFNNHPVIYEGVFVTHNGTISNDDRLFREKKWNRTAEVDSEIIAALLAKGGWDDIESVHKELSGGYAVAAMNLLKPGEVHLFKGGTWPLAYHENKNFIVWASEARIIREAWGKTLGTPPEMLKFNHLGIGDSVFIKDGEVSVKEAPKSSFYSQEVQTSWEDDYDWSSYGTCETPWHLDRNSKSETKPTSTRVSARPSFPRNNQVQISLMRKDGKGKCFTWEMRKAQLGSDSQLAAFNGRWEWCSSCSTSIADNDMLSTLAWGRICLDCHTFLSDPASKAVIPETKKVLYNDLEMIDDLESWVELESKIYYGALLAVSDDTGLQTATIDYLLQRITPKELRTNPPLRALWNDVHLKFNDAENEAWEEYAEEETESLPRLEKCKSWSNISNTCPGCDYCIIDEEDEMTGVQPFAEEDSIWVSCAAGLHTSYEQCDACDTGRPKFTQTIKPKVPDTAEKSPNQCMIGKCQKKSKVQVITQKGKFRWCYAHYSRCVFKNCDEITRGSRPNGDRVCHKHFRGTKGGTQDKIKVQKSDPAKV